MKRSGLFVCERCDGAGVYRRAVDPDRGRKRLAVCDACGGNGSVWGPDTDPALVRSVNQIRAARATPIVRGRTRGAVGTKSPPNVVVVTEDGRIVGY